jgi:hypothetical protein
MAKEKEFENILNECLDRLIKGETIESCLARYPQYAAELEPLLKTAQDAHQAAAVKPRPAFRQRAAHEFQEAVRSLPVKTFSTGFKWRLSWAVPVAVVVAILASGSGTVIAATNALPDSPLYSLKMATESVQMAFTFSDEAKAELYAKFIDYRVEEIVQVVKNGNPDQIVLAAENMNNQLTDMADFNLNNINQGRNEATFGLLAGGESMQVPQTAVPPQVSPGEGRKDLETTEPPVTAYNVTTQETAPVTVTDAGELSDVEKLRLLLNEKLEKNLQILRDLFEKVPESLKPALQMAIDAAEQGYWQAIANLG